MSLITTRLRNAIRKGIGKSETSTFSGTKEETNDRYIAILASEVETEVRKIQQESKYPRDHIDI